jgi:hypothetical protein
LFEDLLDADALVAQLDQRPLVGAQRQVPRLLDRPLAETPLPHNRARGARWHEVAQHPQDIRAQRQLGPGRDVQQRPADTALVEPQLQRREPVVHVPGQRRQRLVADLPDAVAAHHDLDQPADIAAARDDVLLDARDRRVLEVVRRRFRPVAHARQQDRRLEHGDRVRRGRQVAVAAGRTHDLHRPAEQLRLVEPVQHRWPLEEPGELVARRRDRRGFG